MTPAEMKAVRKKVRQIFAQNVASGLPMHELDEVCGRVFERIAAAMHAARKGKGKPIENLEAYAHRVARFAIVDVQSERARYVLADPKHESDDVDETEPLAGTVTRSGGIWRQPRGAFAEPSRRGGVRAGAGRPRRKAA